MTKSKKFRVVGFIGALCASGALIGAAVSSTGAYFTDSHNGEIDASTGHVRVAMSPGDGKLRFSDLLPGDYKDQTIDYTAHGTSAEDIWLVFPNDGSAEAFVGAPDDTAGGGLGRYGHFAVSSSNGAHFTSYNLNREGTSPGHTGPSCPVDGNGWGGSNQQATDRSDSGVPFCAPANAILLASGLTNGQSGSATLTFGYTPLLTSPQDAPLAKIVNYQIVATQHGVRPDDPNN